ncbi:MAG: hypothetical protein ACI9OU_002682 [Candidatus Promineifilaceae bacterium]|jgi:hypothetical protein
MDASIKLAGVQNSMNSNALTLGIVLAGALQGLAGGAFSGTAGTHLDIMQGGKPLVRYMYAFDRSSPDAAHKTYKVYHHVMAPDGTNTLTKGPGHKFTHHRGIFIGWNKISHNNMQSDLWHLKSGEAIKHNKVLKKEADEKQSVLSTQIDWLMKDGVKCIEEVRTVTVHHTDKDAYLLLDFETELTAVDGDVVLKGDPEHAGFQYRPHQDVNAVTYTFHKDGIDPKVVKDLPWVAESNAVGGNKYTVQHMNHPDNPKGAVYSAYRDYGRFGCFIQTSIKDGETLTLKYRLRITTGDTPEADVLAAQYGLFME